MVAEFNQIESGSEICNRTGSDVNPRQYTPATQLKTSSSLRFRDFETTFLSKEIAKPARFHSKNDGGDTHRLGFSILKKFRLL